MKHLFIIISVMIISQTQVAGQQLFEPGKKWYYEYIEYDFTGAFSTTTIETIEVIGDTIIHDTNYYQLYFSKKHPCLIMNHTEFLREENGAIHRFHQENNEAFKIYQYGVSTPYPIQFQSLIDGDTTTATVYPDSLGSYTAFDGTELELEYSHITNNQSYTDDETYVFMEKVGFIQPNAILLPNLGTGLCDVPEFIGDIRCITTVSDTIHFSAFDCSEIPITDHIEELNTTSAVLISPNPGRGLLHIHQDYEVIEIFNMIGESIPFNSEEHTVHLNEIPMGLYYILLRNHLGNTVMRRYINL